MTTLILLGYLALWIVAILTVLTVLVCALVALGLASGVCWIVGLRSASRYLWGLVERLADLADAV